MRIKFPRYKFRLAALVCSVPTILFCAGTPLVENPDALWEISKTHLKDPMNWPSVWQLNPQTANPVPVGESPNPEKESEGASTKSVRGSKKFGNEDWKKNPTNRTQSYLQKVGALKPNESEPLPPQDSPRRESSTSEGAPAKYYLSQEVVLGTPFLAETGIGSHAFPHECSLRYSGSNESEILQLFDEVVIGAGREVGVKPGDLFRTYNVGLSYRSLATGHDLGHIIETNGIVEIVRVGPKTSVGRLIRCFGTISQSARACPLTSLTEVVATGYSPVTNGKLSARVVWLNDEEFPQPFSYAIVDRGSARGYKIGDMVLFFNQSDGRMTDKVLANGIVVNIKEKSSTILIKDLYPGIINRGDYTVIVQTTVM